MDRKQRAMRLAALNAALVAIRDLPPTDDQAELASRKAAVDDIRRRVAELGAVR